MCVRGVYLLCIYKYKHMDAYIKYVMLIQYIKYIYI